MITLTTRTAKTPVTIDETKIDRVQCLGKDGGCVVFTGGNKYIVTQSHDEVVALLPNKPKAAAATKKGAKATKAE